MSSGNRRVRLSPLDEAPVPPRKWRVTFLSGTSFHGYASAVVLGDSITQAIEAFERYYGDSVRIVTAVRL